MMLLQDYLTRAAERDATASALVMGAARVTYGALERSTNRLARLLAEFGCSAGDRVCLLTSKSPGAITGMLAVLKAGGIYVPIDSASPAARISRIFSSAQPSLVLAEPSAAALLDELLATGGLAPDVPVGSIAGPLSGERFAAVFDECAVEERSDAPVEPRRDPTAAAHILFTSGSTGTPKGVVITHANVSGFVDWACAYFGTRAGDRISLHPPLHFDLSTFDIYGTFAAGAELHLVSSTLNLNARGIAGLIRDSALTQWFSVPSALTFMAKFDVVTQDDFPSLERLLWCGEVLPTPVLAYWMRRLPHVRFTNLYGPTEATIASSYYTVPRCPVDETEPIPIGQPCAGEQLHVLDERLRPVAPGEIGDLYIGGVGLSPGYWQDREKTDAVFVTNPAGGGGRIYRTGDLARVDDDGLFHFLGRADSQIKSRGYRIELGEIETVLNTMEGVRECAVIGLDTGGFEGTAICCAYACIEGASLAPAPLRLELSRRLPPYMLPSHWLELDVLPKNVNGKIDRKELCERFAQRAAASTDHPGRTQAVRRPMPAKVQ